MDKRVWLVFVASFLVFMLAFGLRHYYFGIDDIVGTPTFYHTRMAENVLEGSYEDSLSFGGRPVTYPPLFHFMHATFAMVFGLNLGGMVFVALFGALGVCAAYLFSEKYVDRRLLAFILIIMPGMIFLNSHISTRAIPISLGMISLYAVSRKKYAASGILLGLSFLFHPESAGIMLLVNIAYVAGNRNVSLRDIVRVSMPIILLFFAWYVPFLAYNGLPEFNSLHEEYRERRYSLESPGIENFLWELGKGYFTLPLLALSLIGLAYSRNRFFRTWFILCLVLAIAAERFFFYLLIPVGFMSIFGIQKLKSVMRPALYVAVVAAFVVYSSYFGMSRSFALAQDYPVQQQIDALHWIRDNTPQDSVVLSDWQWGHWIAGISGRKNFVDGYAEYAPQVNKRIAELNEFYKTCSVPEGYGITHIYMEDWFAERYGISCLGSFSVVYDNAGIKVYRI